MNMDAFRHLLLETVVEHLDEPNFEEIVVAICNQITEDITKEDLKELIRGIEEINNNSALEQGPLIQPVIIREISTYLDFASLKNFRFACRRFKSLMDPFFYQRGTFAFQNSSTLYEFFKEHKVVGSQIKTLEFSGEIDLYEVSRIMYRCRLSLEQLTINTTALTLRGEFQNCAGIFPLMEQLHTLRLNLPRRYLFHNLFQATPLKTIKVIGFNFEQAPAQTISGIFNTCQSLQFMEVNNDQAAYFQKLKELGISLTLCDDKPVPNHLQNTKMYKINRNVELEA